MLGNTPAIAIPEGEVVKRLEGVPVFAITNEKGAPILASVPNQKDGSQIATFFVSHQDAQAAVDKIKKSNSNVGKSARVVPVSLRQAYELARDTKKNKQEKIAFQFLPTQQQVNSAVSLLKQKGKEVKQFNGVPLFYASGGSGKDKGLLTVSQNNKQMIPFFFNQQDLKAMLDQLKKENSKLSATQVEVTTLGQVVDSMLKNNDAALNQVMLVPSKESVDFVQSQQRSAANNKNTGAPNNKQ
jgi:nickel transport protein